MEVIAEDLPQLGIWPFDSEQDAALKRAQLEAGQALDREVSAFLKSKGSNIYVLAKHAGYNFAKAYYDIAKDLGPYDSAQYTLWRARLESKGWPSDVAANQLSLWRQIYEKGAVPSFLWNPSKAPPGSTESPIGNVATAFAGGAGKILAIAALGFVGYQLVMKKVAKSVLT